MQNIRYPGVSIHHNWYTENNYQKSLLQNQDIMSIIQHASKIKSNLSISIVRISRIDIENETLKIDVYTK